MNISKNLYKLNYKVRESAPEILLVTGIIGVIGSTVLACRSTLKAKDILDVHKKNIDEIHRKKEDTEIETTQEEINKETYMVYVGTGAEMAKIYIPVVVIEGLSIAAICYSHAIMKSRNVALVAALSSVQTAFSTYRDRVRKEIGDEAEQMIFDGGHREQKEITETGENGKKTKKKIDEVHYDDIPSDPYAIFWGEGCNDYEPNGGIGNYLWVKKQEEFAQLKLDTRGWITLNEVYDLLGFTECQAGNVIGWTQDDAKTRKIDFGLSSPRCQDFRDGDPKCTGVFLTFNVDKDPIWKSMNENSCPRLSRTI